VTRMNAERITVDEITEGMANDIAWRAIIADLAEGWGAADPWAVADTVWDEFQYAIATGTIKSRHVIRRCRWSSPYCLTMVACSEHMFDELGEGHTL
jgi:hypothetical protein